MKRHATKINRLATPRRGAAAMIALVLIAVLGGVSASLLYDVYHARLRQRSTRLSVQAHLLLEDFIARTRESAGTPDFREETLEIPSHLDSLDGTFVLRATQATEPKTDGTEYRIEFRDTGGKILLSLNLREQ